MGGRGGPARLAHVTMPSICRAMPPIKLQQRLLRQSTFVPVKQGRLYQQRKQSYIEYDAPYFSCDAPSKTAAPFASVFVLLYQQSK